MQIMENIQKKIDVLRKFFTISVAAFEMQYTISVAFGYNGHKSYMHHLHLMAKDEIDKEFPNLNKIEILLKTMERCANNNIGRLKK